MQNQEQLFKLYKEQKQMKLIKIKNEVYYVKIDHLDIPIKLTKYIYNKWCNYITNAKVS